MKANGYSKIKSDKNILILTNPITQHKIALHLISCEEFNFKLDLEELLKKYKDKIDSHNIVIVDISNRINIFRKIKITFLSKKISNFLLENKYEHSISISNKQNIFDFVYWKWKFIY